MASRRNRKQRKAPNPLLELHPSFRGQAVLACVVDADPTIYSTTVTTGVVAGSQAISVGNITNFASRFSMWQEYRIVKVELEWTCLSPTATGLFIGWVDEKSSTVPTGTASLAAGSRVEFPLADTLRKHVLSWTPNSIEDLQYAQVGGGTITLGYAKTYTSNSLYGSPTTAIQVLLLRPRYTVQFRGLAA